MRSGNLKKGVGLALLLAGFVAEPAHAQAISAEELRSRAWAIMSTEAARRFGDASSMALASAPYLSGEANARAAQLEQLATVLIGLPPRSAFQALNGEARTILARSITDVFAGLPTVPTADYVRNQAASALGNLEVRANADPTIRRSVDAVSSFLSVHRATDLSGALRQAGLPAAQAQELANLASEGRLTEEKLRELAGGVVSRVTDGFVAEADRIGSLSGTLNIAEEPRRGAANELLNELRDLDQARTELNALTGLLAASGQPRLAQLAMQISSYGNAVIELSRLSKLASAGSMSGMALATGYVGVAMSLASAFGSNGQGESAQSAMMDFLAASFQRIEQRLDVIERKIDIIDQRVNAVFNATIQIQRDLLTIRQMNATIAESLSRQSALISQFGIQALPLILEVAETPLSTRIDLCLNFRRRFPASTMTQFPDCVSTFHDFAVNRSVSPTGVEAEDLDLLASFTPAGRSDRLIRLLGRQALSNGVVEEQGRNILLTSPNPSLWLTAAQAYADVIRDNPQEASGYQALGDLTNIIERGERALGALRLLTDPETLVGQLNKLEQVTIEARHGVEELGTRLLAQNAVVSPSGRERLNASYWARVYTGAPGVVAPQGPLLSSISPCSPGAGLPDLQYPEQWEQFEPVPWRMVPGLREDLSACYSIGWHTRELFLLSSRLYVDFVYGSYRIRVLTNNEYTAGRGLFGGTSEPQEVLLRNALVNNWTGGENLRARLPIEHIVCQVEEQTFIRIFDSRPCTEAPPGQLLNIIQGPLRGRRDSARGIWMAAFLNQSDPALRDTALQEKLEEVERQLRLFELLLRMAHLESVDGGARQAPVMSATHRGARLQDWLVVQGEDDPDYAARFDEEEEATGFCIIFCSRPRRPRDFITTEFAEAERRLRALPQPNGTRPIEFLLLRLNALLVLRHPESVGPFRNREGRVVTVEACLPEGGPGPSLERAVQAAARLQTCLNQ